MSLFQFTSSGFSQAPLIINSVTGFTRISICCFSGIRQRIISHTIPKCISSLLIVDEFVSMTTNQSSFSIFSSTPILVVFVTLLVFLRLKPGLFFAPISCYEICRYYFITRCYFKFQTKTIVFDCKLYAIWCYVFRPKFNSIEPWFLLLFLLCKNFI